MNVSDSRQNSSQSAPLASASVCKRGREGEDGGWEDGEERVE